jgi:hypothetical protein
MRLFPIAAALVSALAISTSALAQSAAAPSPPKIQSGARISSSDGAVIGRVEYVDRAKDGSLKDVGVIYEMRMVHIPGDSLSTGPDGVVTNLKRSEISKLN